MKNRSILGQFIAILVHSVQIMQKIVNSCQFMLIFYAFFLAHITQSLQPNALAPIFSPETNIATKEN